MLERRRILKDRMTEIPNRIMLSDVHQVHVKRERLIATAARPRLRIVNYDYLSFQDPRHLTERIVYVLKMGLEGLVLKDIDVSVSTDIFRVRRFRQNIYREGNKST